MKILVLSFCFCIASGQPCANQCSIAVPVVPSYSCHACDSMCVDRSESCFGRCYETFNATNYCQCNSKCVHYHNCCPDYVDFCDGTRRLEEDSCEGRCSKRVDSTQPCQCNSACLKFGDCCADYPLVCKRPVTTPGPTTPPDNSCRRKLSSSEILRISLELFDLDENKAAPDDVQLNKQSLIPFKPIEDNSSEPLFSYVNDSLLSRPNYAIFIELLDNYEKFQGIDENVEVQERAEQDAFLDAFMTSSVGTKLYRFFLENGLWNNCSTDEDTINQSNSATSDQTTQVEIDEATFKLYLKHIWFGLYKRRKGAFDTSGFEHVFVGEVKKDSVSGFHNWVQLYLEEYNGRLNYYGHIDFYEPSVLSVRFSWHGFVKRVSGAVIGISPEYELAIYTLCHVVKPGRKCKILMRDETGAEVSRVVQTYTWTKTSPGYGLKYVASSFFRV